MIIEPLRSLTLTLVLILAPALAAVASPLAVDGTPLSWQDYATFWQDTAKEATFESITTGHFDDRFQPWRAQALNQRPGQLWLRLQIHNPAATLRRLAVAIDTNHISMVDLIYRDSDGLHHQASGRHIPFASWPLHYPYPALPFELPAGATQTLYLRLAMGAPSVGAMPYIVTERELLARAGSVGKLTNLTLGITLGVTLYVLLVASFTQAWSGVGIYTALMLSLTLNLLINNGYLLGIPFDSPYVQADLAVGIGTVSRMLLLQFVRVICQTRARHRVIDWLCVGLLAAGVPLLIMHITAFSAALVKAVVLYSLLCYLFLIGVSLVLLWREKRDALLFFFGINGFLFLSVISQFALLGWIGHNTLTNLSRELATCLLSLMFALLLARRVDRDRQTAQQMATQAAVATAESRAKSELLAVMSHEIRTPMNGVLGMIELLQGSQLDETQRMYVNTVQNSGKTLLAVINDILDFSKAEAGKLALKIEPFDLGELIETVVAPFRSSSFRAVQLVASIAPDVPMQVRGDPIRIQQVLSNLLSNAFKFTERGTVGLRLDRGEEADGRVQLRCRITDTGIGIRPEDRARLFQPFSQIDNSGQRRVGGTGLGLIICQQLVQLMGGRIDVSSKPGSGSEFAFDIWLEPSDELPAPRLEVDLRGKRLLGVDDRRDFLQILREQSTALGMTVQTVETPLTAVATAREFAPDVIVIDLDMPEMDGFEVDRSFAADAALHHIPRLLVTASCNPPGAQALAASGFAGAFSKPTSAQQLSFLLAHALSGARPAAPPVQEPAPVEYAALRVLVAEDNSVNRQVIQAMLQRLGVTPEIAENGVEAVSRFTTAGEPYDLILMDCEMPSMDGYHATQMIRQFERASARARTPIIALSAHALPEHRQASVEAGMDEHVAKPISLAVLRRLIERVAAGN
jgi:signal transduction histidine kinase/DNA-binding response OmpR family regulator